MFPRNIPITNCTELLEKVLPMACKKDVNSIKQLEKEAESDEGKTERGCVVAKEGVSKTKEYFADQCYFNDNFSER